MTNSSSYVDGVLGKFIARHEGQYLDHSHAYGPQSPDLIEYYLTDLLGRPWQFRAGFASQLWEDATLRDMTDFERVERGGQAQVSVDFRPGDVLVFGAALEGPGTVGIYVRPGSRVGSVQMFTQNPGPAKVVDIMADGALNKLLGGWRLTAAAECKIIADKFAAQLYGLPTTVEPLSDEAYRNLQELPDPKRLPDDIAAEFDRGYEHLKTLPTKVQAQAEAWLRAQDPRRGLQVGDVVGNTRVVKITRTDEELPQREHWLKRLFLRR